MWCSPGTVHTKTLMFVTINWWRQPEFMVTLVLSTGQGRPERVGGLPIGTAEYGRFDMGCAFVKPGACVLVVGRIGPGGLHAHHG